MAAYAGYVARQDQQLSKAVALLEKARSTPFAAENEALVLRAYRLMAAYLNVVAPIGTSGSRRRERRLLVDRRQPDPFGSDAANQAGRQSGRDGAQPYREGLENGRRVDSHVDVTL